MTACPSGSKAGPKGTANALRRAGASAPLNLDVYPFVEDANTFLFYLSQHGGGVQTVITGEITNKGRKLRDHHPARAAPAGRGLDADADGHRPDVHGQVRQEVHRVQHELQDRKLEGQQHAGRSPTRRRLRRSRARDAASKSRSARSSVATRLPRSSSTAPPRRGRRRFRPSRLARRAPSSPTASSAAPTCRSPRRCSASRRPRVLVALVRRARGAVVAAAAAGASRERRLFRLPRRGRRGARRRSASLVFARHRLRGARGDRHAARQPRADDGLRRLLGRRAVRVAAARRRLAAAQPVAGDRARRRLARAAHRRRRDARADAPTRRGSAAGPRRSGCSASASASCAGATARDPRPLAVLMLAYTVVMLVGMSLYGVEAWTRNADAFGVYFGLFASLAPFTRARRRALRSPARRRRRRGSTPLRGHAPRCSSSASASRRSTAPREGPLFNDVLPDLQDFFGGLGFSQATALELGFVVGLLAVVGLDRADLDRRRRRACRGTARPAGSSCTRSSRSSPRTSSRTTSRCSPTTGRTCGGSLSDPLGDGCDLFGGARTTIDYGVVSATAIWYVQVAALVLGHVAALVLAHDRALVDLRQPPRRDALAGRHAGRDGLLHLPRPLPALRRERMIAPPFAHAGHWLAQVAYLVPLDPARRDARRRQLRERRERPRRRARCKRADGPCIRAARRRRATGIAVSPRSRRPSDEHHRAESTARPGRRHPRARPAARRRARPGLRRGATTRGATRTRRPRTPYGAWLPSSAADDYAVYRAAQDREDAAQDALALRAEPAASALAASRSRSCASASGVSCVVREPDPLAAVRVDEHDAWRSARASSVCGWMP